MAKKQVQTHRNRNPKNSKNKSKSNTKTQIKNTNKISELANDDASSEETDDPVVQSSSTESQNDDVVESNEEDVVESNEEEVDGVGDSSSDEEEEEEKTKTKSINKKGKKDVLKNKGKKRIKEEDDESEAEEKIEHPLYTFPMNRISRIIKSDNPDLRISQEAVYVINRASEKFLQMFCREAYACTFLDKKKQTAYHHLSSVVSKRMRLQFLSDFVPEKVKAEHALAQVSEGEKNDLD